MEIKYWDEFIKNECDDETFEIVEGVLKQLLSVDGFDEETLKISAIYSNLLYRKLYE